VRAVVLGIAVISEATLAAGSCPKVGFTIVEPHATSQTRALKIGTHKTIYVHRETLTTTGDITEIELLTPRDGDDDDAMIQLKFTQAVDQRLHDATTNHSGMRIAFLFDDYVLNNIVWQGPYGIDLGGIDVSIAHGLTQARRLMKAIKGCTAGIVRDRTS
jgi:preprotein translocase subunit SecD